MSAGRAPKVSVISFLATVCMIGVVTACGDSTAASTSTSLPEPTTLAPTTSSSSTTTSTTVPPTTTTTLAPTTTTTEPTTTTTRPTTTTTTAPPATVASPPPDMSTSIGDNFFDPSSRSVPVGTRIVWSNGGVNPHTVTTTSTPGESFDSGVMDAGASYATVLAESGTYEFICQIHPSEMSATVTVTDP